MGNVDVSLRSDIEEQDLILDIDGYETLLGNLRSAYTNFRDSKGKDLDERTSFIGNVLNAESNLIKVLALESGVEFNGLYVNSDLRFLKNIHSLKTSEKLGHWHYLDSGFMVPYPTKPTRINEDLIQSLIKVGVKNPQLIDPDHVKCSESPNDWIKNLSRNLSTTLMHYNPNSSTNRLDINDSFFDLCYFDVISDAVELDFSIGNDITRLLKPGSYLVMNGRNYFSSFKSLNERDDFSLVVYGRDLTHSVFRKHN